MFQVLGYLDARRYIVRPVRGKFTPDRVHVAPSMLFFQGKHQQVQSAARSVRVKIEIVCVRGVALRPATPSFVVSYSVVLVKGSGTPEG